MSHIDLALFGFRSVRDAHARQQAKRHGLLGNGKCPGDDGLGRNDSNNGSEDDQRDQTPGWCHQEERVFNGLGMGDDEGTLTQIVEQQGWQDDGRPSHADRVFAEMAHVGVKGFATCADQKNTAKNHQCQPGLVHQHAKAVAWVESQEYIRVIENMTDTHNGDDDKPQHGQGRKNCCHTSSALILEGKQGDEDCQRDGHDEA